MCDDFFCAVSRPGARCSKDADCTSQKCAGDICERSNALELCSADDDCTTAVCSDGTCALSGVDAPCEADLDCSSGHCSVGGLCTPGYTGAVCSGDADCYSSSCTDGLCDQSGLNQGYAANTDCAEGTCSLGACSTGPECNAEVAVDLGETGQEVVLALDGCAKIDESYPSWWGTGRRLSLMPSLGAAYPLPVQVFNACTGLSVLLTFTTDWTQLSASPTDANCPTLIDLRGTSSGTVTLTYFGG